MLFYNDESLTDELINYKIISVELSFQLCTKYNTDIT